MNIDDDLHRTDNVLCLNGSLRHLLGGVYDHASLGLTLINDDDDDHRSPPPFRNAAVPSSCESDNSLMLGNSVQCRSSSQSI